jgi:hypothetical protein
MPKQRFIRRILDTLAAIGAIGAGAGVIVAVGVGLATQKLVPEPWFALLLVGVFLVVAGVTVLILQHRLAPVPSTIVPNGSSQPAAPIEGQPEPISPTLKEVVVADAVYIDVRNPSERDATFWGAIEYIDGASKDFYYPLSMKWRNAVAARMAIPSHQSRSLVLCDRDVSDDDASEFEGYAVRIPGSEGKDELIDWIERRYEKEATLTVRLQVSEADIRGVGTRMALRLSLVFLGEGRGPTFSVEPIAE